jgi:hypothetical protein
MDIMLVKTVIIIVAIILILGIVAFLPDIKKKNK